VERKCLDPYGRGRLGFTLLSLLLLEQDWVDTGGPFWLLYQRQPAGQVTDETFLQRVKWYLYRGWAA